MLSPVLNDAHGDVIFGKPSLSPDPRMLSGQ